MIFTRSQIDDLISILKKHELMFVANQLGIGFLSQSDKNILIASGINVDEFKNQKGVLDHAFLFQVRGVIRFTTLHLTRGSS